MIHLATLQEVLNKLYDQGATYVDFKEIVQLFKENS